MNIIRKIIPFSDWIRNYNSYWFRADLLSGLTLGVIIIPQGIAYAMIAGLPPIYGLYSSILPTILYGFFGTSRHVHVGAVALDSLFVATTVGLIAQEGADNYVAIALLLTFLVGTFQFLFGLFRLGFLVNFLARPVIIGFTSAAAVIIGLNQIKHIFGANMPRGAHLIDFFSMDVRSLLSGNWVTILLSLCMFLLAFIWRKVFPKFPYALVLVVTSILAVLFMNLSAHGVKVVGIIPEGLPKLSLIHFDFKLVQRIFPSAIALALLGFMETISIGKVLEEKYRYYRIRPNQEAMALGLVNMISSNFSAYVSTASFSRSSINEQNGSRTPVAGFVSAAIVVLVLLFFTPLFYYLPHSILGVIIFLSVLNLIDLKAPRLLWRSTRKDFILYAVTLIGTLLFGIQAGLFFGILISIVVLLFSITVPHIAVMGEVKGSKGLFRNVDRFSNVKIDPSVLILRFDSRLFYANVGYFRDKIAEYEEQRDGAVQHIIIDCSGINSIDSTALHALRRLHITYKKRGIKIFYANVKGPVRDIFKSAKIYKKFGKNAFFVNIPDALSYIKNPKGRSDHDIAFQTDV